MYTIENIYWQRCNVHIQLDREIEGEAYIVSGKNKFGVETKKDEVIISITNTPEGTFLTDGQ